MEIQSDSPREPAHSSRKSVWAAVAVAASVSLAVGVVLGVVFSKDGPVTEIHAVATHGQDNYSLATGALDTNIEAVYFLDALTHELKAVVMDRTSHKFHAFYSRDIKKDFGGSRVKNPRYLMVTGVAELRSGRNRYGDSLIYVAELDSGKVVAYGVPSLASGGRRAGNSTSKSGPAPLIKLDQVEYRTVNVRKD